MSPETHHLILELVVQLTGFLLAFGILARLFWRPILLALDERRARIAAEFRGIGEAKAEMEKLKKEYHQHLERIEEEARAKIQQAIADGRRIGMEIEEEARAHARAALEKTKEAVALEVAKARVELKEQVVDLAIQVSHKVLQKHLDEETDQRMIEAFIQEINALDKQHG